MSRQSYPTIFGEVAAGVESPLITHDHPYPTRYHGPIFNYPYFGLPYQVNPMAIAPFEGVGGVDGVVDGLGACGACQPKAGDGSLGAVNVTGSPTGSVVIDAALGAALGYVIAKKDADRVFWAAGGAVATIVLGALGLVGTLGAGYMARR